LSKHLREERDELKKKFKDRFNCRFDRYTKQYIIEYEGIDYDDKSDLEFIDDAVKTLIINIKSPPVSPTQE